jgi:hypothetical protein
MSHRRSGSSRTAVRLLVLTVVLLAIAAVAIAQTTTATIRGKVTNENGEGIAGADIVATNVNTGFTNLAVTDGNGNFNMGGVTPGTYTILVASPAYREATEERTVLVGQTIDLNLRLSPSTVLTESITVVGDTFVETKSSEVATNVTRQQIESLPQPDRNFLNFAALAPGVNLSTDPLRKEISAGAQGASSTNVFIDGVSFKNNVIQGGVIGQDSSRGNPFPQNAVQEFRVITQNYSAEYQQASSAIITAITRSGTNRFSGDVFAYYQDKDLVENDPFSEARNQPKPEYERLQWGLSVGGPIIRDKMHFFASYEANDQDRQERVTLGPLRNTPFGQQFIDREGLFTQPFRSDLFFGKLSFQPTQSQLVDFSASYRDETDIRSFGGDRTFEAAENVENNVISTTLRHQLTSNTWLNEAALSYQELEWHPNPLSDEVGTFIIGLGFFGGRGGEQIIGQERIAFRDDLSFTGLNLAGLHTLKVGANIEFLDYSIEKDFWGNPLFLFREDIGFDFPFEAEYGVGDPDMSAENETYGVYVQDEWAVNPSLLVNLGLRWDYETNMMDPDYVTDPAIRATFQNLLPSRYFTDGDDRETPTDMFAPRLGFSYDIFQNGQTVAFGGWGKYYDRVLFNDILDVRFRQQYKFGRFRFSEDGLPRDGAPTVRWENRYFSEAGLREVMATGQTGEPEAFLLENDTEVPYSNQWNLGVRHNFGPVVGSVAYSNIRSYHGLSWQFAFRNPNGSCCAIQGEWPFANVLISNDDRRTWYDAIFLTLDRPLTTDASWGFNVAYTYAEAEQNGRDLFALSYPTIEEFGRYRVTGSEDHRLVASGILRAPWDILLSTLFQYGSGPYFGINDASAGFGYPLERYRGGAGEGRSWNTVDLRAEKDFRFGGNNRFGVTLEAFNVLNEDRFSCYEDFQGPSGNPRLGEPNCIISGSQRRFQVGLRYGF